MRLKVIAIAPEVPNLPKLAAWKELGLIGDIDGVSLSIVPEPSRQRILDWLRRSCYDVFLWIGHGEPGRLFMQRDAVDPSWLAGQLSACGTTIAIIATCSSDTRPDAPFLTQGFADALPAAGINTIVMQTSVPDMAALKYDVAFIQALSGGIALRQAHNIGIAAAAEDGGVQMVQFVPADVSRQRQPSDAQPNNDATLRSLSEKMDKFADQIHALDIRQERIETRVAQISKDQERQHAEIGEIRDSIDQLRHNFPTPEVSKQWILFVSGALLLMLALLIVIMLSVLK